MEYLHEDVDPLNIYGTRNAANTDIDKYNCLSYVLGTYSWIRPYSDFEDRIADVENCLENEYIDFDECADIFLEMDTKWILNNLGDRVRLIYDEDEELDEDECLIAFREFVGEDCENWGRIDTDFHAMIKLDGIWYEKCGAQRPKKVDKFWYNDMGFAYNSSTSYFAIKQS